MLAGLSRDLQAPAHTHTHTSCLVMPWRCDVRTLAQWMPPTVAPYPTTSRTINQAADLHKRRRAGTQARGEHEQRELDGTVRAAAAHSRLAHLIQHDLPASATKHENARHEESAVERCQGRRRTANA